jgi:hypothetical protein
MENSMTWQYKYIFISDLPDYQADGWELVGNMRPDDWASPNKGNLIIRKSTVDCQEEIERNLKTRHP